jgi:hypothetical protein
LFTAARLSIDGLIMNDEHFAYFEEVGSVFYVFTVATMQCVYTHDFGNRNVSIGCIVFCPNANAVVAGHSDGSVRVHTN